MLLPSALLHSKVKISFFVEFKNTLKLMFMLINNLRHFVFKSYLFNFSGSKTLLSLKITFSFISISVSQPVGRGQLSTGLQSSHFAKFYYKTV